MNSKIGSPPQDFENILDSEKYEYKYDDKIFYSEVEKSLFEKKIEKSEGEAYYIQGASKRPNVEVLIYGKRTGFIC